MKTAKKNITIIAMRRKRVRKRGNLFVKHMTLLTIDKIILVKILIGRTIIDFINFIIDFINFIIDFINFIIDFIKFIIYFINFIIDFINFINYNRLSVLR